MTLLYKRFSILDSDPPVTRAKGSDKPTVSLMLAYKGATYAFIYSPPAQEQMEDNGLPGAFLEVLEDVESGQAILDLNAFLFCMTRNHAIDWLERTSAGNSAPLTLTMKSAVDVDYLKIWRLGDLGLAKSNALGGYSGSSQQSVIFDLGSERRIVGLSLTLNDVLSRPHRISIVRTYTSNDGVTWTMREIYAGHGPANRDLLLFDFTTVVSARYFKFEIKVGKKR